MIKLELSSQLIGQFGHVTASASCKQPEKHSNGIRSDCKAAFTRQFQLTSGCIVPALEVRGLEFH